MLATKPKALCTLDKLFEQGHTLGLQAVFSNWPAGVRDTHCTAVAVTSGCRDRRRTSFLEYCFSL